MTRKRAFLFDLNGTMIDDMAYHIGAWHRIVNELGASITLERMKAECYGKNHELLERIFPGRFTAEEKDRMSLEKETAYQQAFRPHLQLLAGLRDVLEYTQINGILNAIGTAAIRSNIDFVLDGLTIRNYFTVLVSADDVAASKPDPETFLTCARELGIPPAECLVFEDSPKGVESALRAGMDAIVITLLHSRADFTRFTNVLHFMPDYRALLAHASKRPGAFEFTAHTLTRT